MNDARIAWGITGAGDQIEEVTEEMKKISDIYPINFDIFVSKAGEMALKMYKVFDEIKEYFDNFSVEIDANKPFFVGPLFRGHYEGLIIAPATSNTVAKISNCIGDTLITNAALQALKTFKPVYIMPVDLVAGESTTILPNGDEIRIRVREEDAAHVENLRSIDGIQIIESPKKIKKSIEELIENKS